MLSLLDAEFERGSRTAVDVGCGEGRFCRMLSARGWKTVGVDPTEEFLVAARATDPSGEYLAGVGEALPISSVDTVVSYLSFIDIPDFRAAISEFSRVLPAGGAAVVANCHPILTVGPGSWVLDHEGQRLAWQIDDYFTERGVPVEWAGISVLNYHRPLSAYFSCFLASGFSLESYSEPLPSAEAIALHPSLVSAARIPYFDVAVWRKK